ncbi:SpoIVB peptidase S55 domain-containing protein, partial [Gemmatimonadota bacterium]
MSLDKVRPGMHGFCKTVFQGDSIEEFDVEIIGTLKNFLPKKDIILARLLGEKIEYTGIVSGMSGSPVYLDGKLIGAIAYGWSFSKDPITGITPIEQMLEIGSGTAEKSDGGGAARPEKGRAEGPSSGEAMLYNPEA